MKKLIVILIALSLVGMSFSCTKTADPEPEPEPAAESEPVELTVFAAASLTEALEEIAGLYKAVAPHVTISFNFASSGDLQTQIESGAEADLFLSAAVKQMNAIEADYVIEGTRKELLNNEVVLVVPSEGAKDITSFEDVLTDKAELIALGNADVPVGQYSEEIFTFMGGWDVVQAKASFGTSVKEVLAQVESGSVDCGVVYATDAATSDKVTVVASAPDGSHSLVIYPAAVLKTTTSETEAKAFLDYLSSAEAVAVFERIGFKVL